MGHLQQPFITAASGGAGTTTLPEFLRVPAPGASEPITGLRRNVLYDLIKARSIRSISLRKPGALRGVRLIETASLLGYLRRLAAEQNGRGNRTMRADGAKEACHE